MNQTPKGYDKPEGVYKTLRGLRIFGVLIKNKTPGFPRVLRYQRVKPIA